MTVLFLVTFEVSMRGCRMRTHVWATAVEEAASFAQQ